MLKIIWISSVVIALSACAPFQPYVEDSPPRYYIVQADDNIHSIAFLLELTPGQLRRANPWIDPLYMAPGTRLLVPRPEHDGDFAGDTPASDEVPADAQTAIQLQATGFIWPLNRIDVSSHFGRRRGRLHNGIDLRAPLGTPIHASADGRVKSSRYNRGYGHMIVIDHGNGVETAYAHNSRNLVKTGQRVKQGQVIARVGKSGNATGYHVHFEFRRQGLALNPVRQVQAAKQ